MRYLKLAYRATRRETAEDELLNLGGKCGAKYPVVIESWQRNREELSQYFQYTPGIRRIINHQCRGMIPQTARESDQNQRGFHQ